MDFFAEGHAGFFQPPVLAGIGPKYGKTTAQVILRWLFQSRIVDIPRLVHAERIYQNFRTNDFMLFNKDMAEITGGPILILDVHSLKEIYRPTRSNLSNKEANEMEYTKLGTTDIEVSKLCVGCMSFGKAGTMHDWTLDKQQSEAVIRHALDLGINFFDTANGYSAGTSEEYLGRAIKHNIARNKVVIASKVYFNEGRLSRKAIMREIEGSLKRLGTDYLDLYIIHRFDYETPIEETMEALHELVRAGKVRALGASAMYGYQFYHMQMAAKEHGWTPFSVMENHYNLIYREDERELIPICKQMNVSLMPYSPLASGHLTRAKWSSGSLRGRTDKVAAGKYDRMKEQDVKIIKRVQELSERHHYTMAQIALAWQWAKGVSSPIIGATKAHYLDDASAALKVKLSLRRLIIWKKIMCLIPLWGQLIEIQNQVLCCWM